MVEGVASRGEPLEGFHHSEVFLFWESYHIWLVSMMDYFPVQYYLRRKIRLWKKKKISLLLYLDQCLQPTKTFHHFLVFSLKHGQNPFGMVFRSCWWKTFRSPQKREKREKKRKRKKMERKKEEKEEEKGEERSEFHLLLLPIPSPFQRATGAML